ncbi:MAG TPA: EamA family transporter [Candidatus Acidoferrum sp.]|nr:EamA family transporter [Candidatus Acidoferrum sp.]
MSTGAAKSLSPATREPAAPVEKSAGHRLGVILSFGATWFIWGSTYLAIRYAVETIPPLYAAGFRHLCAGLILISWCAYRRLRPTWAQVRASFVIGALFFVGGHGSLHWAETRIPSGLASLLIATEPIWVYLLICAVTRSWRMTPALIGGILLGFTGVAVLLRGSVFSAGPVMITGAIATLFSAISWASGVVYSRRSHLSGHPLLLSAMSLLAGSVQLLLVATLLGEWRGFSLSHVTTRSWLGFGFLVIFGSVITFTAYNWLLEHYSPTLVTTHTFINPVVAVLIGWLVAGERLSLATGIATAMIVGAVVLVQRGSPAVSELAEEA